MDADGLETVSESLWVLSGEGIKSRLSVCLFKCQLWLRASPVLLLLFTFGEPRAPEE